MRQQSKLTRYAWLSIGTAILTIGLKAAAYLLTGSVGLLSDALESGVNLVAAVLVLITLAIASLPPDEEHAYGHAKAEYFSSGVEGALILIAAATIAASAIQRLFQPQPLEQLGVGLVVSVGAAVLNLATARVLMVAGKRSNSVTLMANAQHLLTDVWTSAGVGIGLGAVAVGDTGINTRKNIQAENKKAFLRGCVFHFEATGSAPVTWSRYIDVIVAVRPTIKFQCHCGASTRGQK